MKVTKSKLQRMIKEELQNLTEECHPQDYQCQEAEAQAAKKRSDYKKSKENLGEEFASSFSGKGSAEIGKWLEMMAHNFENKWYALNDYLIDAGLRSKDPEDEWTTLIAQTHDNLKRLAAELPAALEAGVADGDG